MVFVPLWGGYSAAFGQSPILKYLNVQEIRYGILAASESGHGMRCLIIDDSIDDRSLVERMLQRFGHRATSVSSGMAALALLGDARFDVALVDLDMPGMSGAETLRAMRELDQKMRLLVVSGRDDRRHVLEAIGAGADGYLLKDELGDRLGGALQELLAGKSPLSGSVGAVLVKQLNSRPSSQPPAVESVIRVTPRPVPPPKKEAGNHLADASGELVVRDVRLPAREKPSTRRALESDGESEIEVEVEGELRLGDGTHPGDR